MSDNVERTLGRIEEKMDTFLQRFSDHEARLRGHNKRLRNLERLRDWCFAWTAGAVALFTFIWAYVPKAFAAFLLTFH